MFGESIPVELNAVARPLWSRRVPFDDLQRVLQKRLQNEAVGFQERAVRDCSEQVHVEVVDAV